MLPIVNKTELKNLSPKEIDDLIADQTLQRIKGFFNEHGLYLLATGANRASSSFRMAIKDSFFGPPIYPSTEGLESIRTTLMDQLGDFATSHKFKSDGCESRLIADVEIISTKSADKTQIFVTLKKPELAPPAPLRA